MAENPDPAHFTAEHRFVSNMKRLRAMLGLSQAELAEKIVALGGNMYQQTIAKLESEQRALRMSEADIIATALGTTVADMLRHRSVAIGRASAPSLDEVRRELMAVEADLSQATLRSRQAAAELERARQLVAMSQAESDRAQAVFSELSRQYQDLQGRLAAAVHNERGPTLSGSGGKSVLKELPRSGRDVVEDHLRNCEDCQAKQRRLSQE
ncbi:helix-turn-helix domain-containing protein [Streptomyces sp. CB01201]|uniref:helix-turn-helix domain-containing protein n=1 Tax=Streptomyces sp. CB01201 TaxID=2020324 RepID=UPI00131CDFA5|nr:helix-turn-helix transcriptional regulator [Streptomyces sp. CB01201]